MILQNKAAYIIFVKQEQELKEEKQSGKNI